MNQMEGLDEVVDALRCRGALDAADEQNGGGLLSLPPAQLREKDVGVDGGGHQLRLGPSVRAQSLPHAGGYRDNRIGSAKEPRLPRP